MWYFSVGGTRANHKLQVSHTPFLSPNPPPPKITHTHKRRSIPNTPTGEAGDRLQAAGVQARGELRGDQPEGDRPPLPRHVRQGGHPRAAPGQGGRGAVVLLWGLGDGRLVVCLLYKEEGKGPSTNDSHPKHPHPTHQASQPLAKTPTHTKHKKTSNHSAATWSG